MKKETAHTHSRSIFAYLSAKDTFFATLAVFVLMGLLSLVPINSHVLDPFKLALHDFNYNDLVYSKMEKHKDFPADTNIVIVNISQSPRADIAVMIDKVMAGQPKAAGVDVLFNVPKDAEADAKLKGQFESYTNLVMAYFLRDKRAEGYFYPVAKAKGFANFVGEEEGVIRYIKPTVDKHEAFATAIVKIADPEAYQRIISEHHPYDIINYRRSSDKFLVIEGGDLLAGNADTAAFRNKIVLLGYVGSSATDIEDKHYTPLNTRFTGRGVPDMNGIFIHSNVISMMTDDAPITKTPSWLNWLIAFTVGYIGMAFFIKYSTEIHTWFHLIAKAVQVVMAVLFVYLGLWMFYQFDTQINMTATLAAVILAVDVLYFYQSFALWLHEKYKYKTIFTHESHH